MTTQPLDEYFAALGRLQAGRPQRVPRGTRITNDAVALEAGRGKGSIKKSRTVFSDLIAAIDAAAAEQSKPKTDEKAKLAKTKGQMAQLRKSLEDALGREVALLRELYETKKKLSELTGGKVVPLRSAQPKELSNG